MILAKQYENTQICYYVYSSCQLHRFLCSPGGSTVLGGAL